MKKKIMYKSSSGHPRVVKKLEAVTPSIRPKQMEKVSIITIDKAPNVNLVHLLSFWNINQVQSKPLVVNTAKKKIGGPIENTIGLRMIRASPIKTSCMVDPPRIIRPGHPVKSDLRL